MARRRRFQETRDAADNSAASTEPAAADVADEIIDAPSESVLCHESNDKAECFVPYHGDGYGACQRCQHCKKKYRPQEMNQACPGRRQ